MTQIKDLPAVEQAKLKKAVGEHFKANSKMLGRSTTQLTVPGYGYAHTPDPDGTKRVFYIGTKENPEQSFYGAARHKLNAFADWACIVDLTGAGWPAPMEVPEKKVVTKIDVKTVGFDSVEEAALKEFLTSEVIYPAHWTQAPSPNIAITWPDMKAIFANTDFWEYLLGILPKGDIAICCQGGKGRTGTALSALWMAANARAGKLITAEDAIKLVRANHHTSAVESKVQEEYLKALEDEWAKELSK